MDINNWVRTKDRGYYTSGHNRVHEKNAMVLIDWCCDNLPFVASGLARHVFRTSDSAVVKIPKPTLEGYDQQLVEAKTLLKFQQYGLPTPRFQFELCDEVLLIHEELCSLVTKEERNDVCLREAWMLRMEDGMQVGRTRDGRIVPIDLGYGYRWPGE